MENKLTMSRVAAMLAISTGKQKKLCEDFVKEIFRIVGDELAADESVRIKGFGTFKLVTVESRKSVNVATGEEYEIPGHSRIVFVAAKELAAAVNAPFEAFEAVEIADDLPTDLFLSMEDPEDSEDTVSANEENVSVDDDPTESPGNSGDEDTESLSLEEESDEELASDAAAIEAYAKPCRFFWGFAAGFIACALIGVAVVSFLHGSEFFRPGSRASDDISQAVRIESVENEIASADVPNSSDTISSAAHNDTVNAKAPAADGRTLTTSGEEKENVPTEPSDKTVYDTVTTTRYLTTIAKEHYGNFNLWPIIYEENRSILGHPNRIKPGTRVVVPPLSKYGINAESKQDIDKVKRMGVEIYKKFK